MPVTIEVRYDEMVSRSRSTCARPSGPRSAWQLSASAVAPLRTTHWPRSLPKRLKSLPPIPTVTRSMSSVRASNWAGWDWPLVCWAPTMEALSAPLQLTSTSVVPGIAAATSEG